MDTSTGYWRFVQMDRSKKHVAPYWCKTIEAFAITDYVWPNCGPLRFDFVNGAWQTMFYHLYEETFYYNDQEVQHQNEIIIKDGDSFRVKYKSNCYGKNGADVTMHYKEETLYWNVEEEIKMKDKKLKAKVDSLERQNEQFKNKSRQPAVRLKSAKKYIRQCTALEEELRKQIKDLQLQQQQQHMQEERRQLAKTVERLQQGAAEQQSANNANIEEIRKQKEVETELREKIADLQGTLQSQREVNERGENQQLPKSRTDNVIPQPCQEENPLQLQPSLQFIAILEQIKQNSIMNIEEISPIWERERSQFNEKIAKLTRQLKNKQDRELSANQSLQQDQVLEGCEDTDEATIFKFKEEHRP